jgi:hypothetical protein|tara:strand:- start:666 stop:884 length:219 start_codon:yes stop_codon:yes gene_type:complete
MNEDDFNKRFDGMSFSTSWTQPYLPTNYNPFYQPSPEHAATEEMIRINAVDKIVAEMTDYPDAERMLRKIME